MFLLFRYIDGDISSVYNHGYFRDYHLIQHYSSYLSTLFPGDTLKIFNVPYKQFAIESPVYIINVFHYIGKKRNNLGFFNSTESAEAFKSWMTSFYPFRKYWIFNRFSDGVQASHMDTQQTLF